MSRDLNDTLVFVKVVETGSFISAAKALRLPKTTVSRKCWTWKPAWARSCSTAPRASSA